MAPPLLLAALCAASGSKAPRDCPDVLCAVHCEHGMLKDDNGCDTCSCMSAPDTDPTDGPECPPALQCYLQCAEGFTQDDAGCDMCRCAGKRAAGDVCGATMTGDAGDCADGLKCACVGPCANANIADAPSTCVDATSPPASEGCEKAMLEATPGLLGSFTPECDGKLWKTVQCHASIGTCWCAHPLTGKNTSLPARMVPTKEECDSAALNSGCPEASCRMYCIKGFKKDSNGCDICECAGTKEDVDNYEEVETGSNTTDSGCLPVMCKMYCVKGFKKDESGCDVCECAGTKDDVTPEAGSNDTEDACPKVMCRMYCMKGFLKDDKGCDVCKCAGTKDDAEPETGGNTTGKRCTGLITCRMHCPNGFAEDDDGCEICECATTKDEPGETDDGPCSFLVTKAQCEPVMHSVATDMARCQWLKAEGRCTNRVNIGDIIPSGPEEGCAKELAAKQGTKTMIGAYIPQCNGKKWKRLQCHGSTGMCWCVDELTGAKFAGVGSQKVENEEDCDPTKKIVGSGLPAKGKNDTDKDEGKPIIGRPQNNGCTHGYSWCEEEKECYRVWEKSCGGKVQALDLYGAVKSVDTVAGTVTIEVSGKSYTLALPSETNAGGTSLRATAMDLAAGDHVKMSYRPEHPGEKPRDGHKIAGIEVMERAVRVGGACEEGKGACPRSSRCLRRRAREGRGGGRGSNETGAEAEAGAVCHRTRGALLRAKWRPLDEAAAMAADVAKQVLQKLRASDVAEAIDSVVIPYVCNLPESRASLGITAADRASALCERVDGASAERRRAAAQGGDCDAAAADCVTVFDIVASMGDTTAADGPGVMEQIDAALSEAAGADGVAELTGAVGVSLVDADPAAPPDPVDPGYSIEAGVPTPAPAAAAAGKGSGAAKIAAIAGGVGGALCLGAAALVAARRRRDGTGYQNYKTDLTGHVDV